MVKLLRLFSVIVLFLISLSLASAAQIKPAAEKKTETFDPAREAWVIEELGTTMRFENDGSSRETVRHRARIQNHAGLQHYGVIHFSFIAGQEFNIDTVEVHKKDGSVVKAGPENIQEATPEVSRDAPMYSDLRLKDVTVPGLSVGDEVIFQYTSHQTPLVPNQFWFEHSFTKDTVVLSETVELNVPKGRKLNLSYQPEYQPIVKDVEGRTVYQWHSSNEKLGEAKKGKRAREREQLTGTAPPPSIELATFTNWQELGAWYWRLQRERATPSPAIKAKALELTKGMEKTEDKIKALYHYVSSEFRYISLDFGIGRYQPHAPDEVLANRYGDCKDKHTLLAALLESVGVQAHPALISMSQQVDPGVPSPAQFDHVITAVTFGSGYIFLDTTAEVAPYGFLLSSLRHKKALVISGPDMAQFVETPAELPFQAREDFELNGKLDDSGTMEAEVSYYLRGDSEVLFRNAFRQAPPAKHKDIVQVLSFASGFAGEVSNVAVSGLQDSESGLRITYHYHRPEYLDMHDQPPKKSLPLAATHFKKWEDDEDFVWLYNSVAELTYRCRIELPAGVTAQAPLPVKLDRDYVRYQSTYSAEKNVVTGEHRMTILSHEVTGAHRQDYEAFRRAAESDDNQQMVLRLPAGFVTGSAPASSADLDELERQAEIEFRQRDYNSALSDYRRLAARDGKRKGVWSQIAAVEMNLRRYDESIKDFQKALEIDPFDVYAHTGLAGTYLAVRKNEQAVAELNKAVEIDPLNHRAYYLLGWYYSSTKQDHVAAVPVLEKALATKNDEAGDEQQIRNLLSTSYFKTGKPEKAVEMLKQSLGNAANPMVWNNAAYLLAENNYQLDLARQYADSALQGIYGHLNQIQPEFIRREDLFSMAQLGMTWDTIGWVHFKAGNLALAEKYVHAAWILGQQREVAGHLGEIYEKLHRTQDAARYYAMAIDPFRMGAESPGMATARERLNKLVGRVQANQLISQMGSEPSLQRTIHLGKVAPVGTKGEFYFILGPGPKLLSIQLISGDEVLSREMNKQASKIAAAMVLFPEGAPEKLVRRGLVSCFPYSASCDLVFYASDMPGAIAATMGN
jgi:tetratricopeptide (TPR) repeat protein